MEHLPADKLVRFSISSREVAVDSSPSDEKIACSKKCKKVAKFGFVLKFGTESETLKAFESMMRKKMNKRQVNTNQTLNAFGGQFGKLSIGAPYHGVSIN